MGQNLFALLGLGAVAWVIVISGRNGAALASALSIPLGVAALVEISRHGFVTSVNIDLAVAIAFGLLAIIMGVKPR